MNWRTYNQRMNPTSNHGSVFGIIHKSLAVIARGLSARYVKIGVFSKMTEKLSFTLIENSFCFLESAIKYSKEKERRDWKYAILNLANALELMMKAVLEKSIGLWFSKALILLREKK